jgi:hypothetical protein
MLFSLWSLLYNLVGLNEDNLIGVCDCFYIPAGLIMMVVLFFVGLFLFMSAACNRIIVSQKGIEYDALQGSIVTTWKDAELVYRYAYGGKDGVLQFLSRPVPYILSSSTMHSMKGWTKFVPLTFRMSVEKKLIPIYRYGADKGQKLQEDIHSFAPHIEFAEQKELDF